MTKQTEAMTLAIEALEAALSDDQPYIDRCKAALAGLRSLKEQEPVACSVCDQVHLLLDIDKSKIIRDAKDGYPEGRTPRALTLQERVAALCEYAADWKRWCLEEEKRSQALAEQPAQQEPVVTK